MKYTIIDVREPEEFEKGHVDGAINIPPARLMNGAAELRELAPDTPIILYCISGARSSASMHLMRQIGFTNLKNGINKDQVEAFLKKSEEQHD